MSLSPARVESAFADAEVVRGVGGWKGENFACVERVLGVRIQVKGGRVVAQGEEEACARARRVLLVLYGLVEQGRRVDEAEVVRVARMVGGERREVLGGEIKPRTQGQRELVRAMEQAKVVLALGPAGVGKTLLAGAHGVRLLERGEVSRLVLCRPAVEAGERLGFLPGEVHEKVAPYVHPLVDVLQEVMGVRGVEQAVAAGRVEMAPVGFMRGRTLKEAFVVLDEAQNCTVGQMKMMLTRLGAGSRMVVAGDPSQVDLAPQVPSGLADAAQRLRDLPEVAVVRLGVEDVCREGVVARILAAYEAQGA